jgi:hypothetical protein
MENRLPITRLSKFLSNDDFDLNIQMGQEYLHGDIDIKLVLYSVDITKTSTDNVYAQTIKDNIVFHQPVEFNGTVKIEQPKNATYNAGFNRYNEPGNLIVSVYINHLKDLGIDKKYGDYIGFAESETKLRFYSVANDGKIVSDNSHNMLGLRPFYRTITCVPAQESEFRGI